MYVIRQAAALQGFPSCLEIPSLEDGTDRSWELLAVPGLCLEEAPEVRCQVPPPDIGA